MSKNRYVEREISGKILEVQKYYPVTTITGPRQSGKTSLCRHLFPDYNYVNLEDLTVRGRAISDPTGFLDSLGDTAIIDEVQNVPDLLSMIQVRVDEDCDKRFILTGSSNFTLLQRMTQSLAGRGAVFTLLPFSLKEMTEEEKSVATWRLLSRGQYPGILVNGIPEEIFFSNYYTTYVERDVRDLMRIKSIMTFDTFVRLLAARVGSEFNASQIAKEAGVSAPTVTEWLSILDTSYITYTVRPYFANISKQLTKMPKVYFYDTGLLCYLLGIETEEQFRSSTLRGAIFENMVISELMKNQYNQARIPNVNFYRERSGKEVDAMVRTREGLHLYQVKAGSTFKPEFMVNMDYVAGLVAGVSQRTVVYDGPTSAPLLLNLRDV
ncbi:MAG: ATP-binding protein [Muribaculaceae bacterium]|nr:ATP-binding protein [Muribaculaceae bacterium]